MTDKKIQLDTPRCQRCGGIATGLETCIDVIRSIVPDDDNDRFREQGGTEILWDLIWDYEDELTASCEAGHQWATTWTDLSDELEPIV